MDGRLFEGGRLFNNLVSRVGAYARGALNRSITVLKLGWLFKTA